MPRLNPIKAFLVSCLMILSFGAFAAGNDSTVKRPKPATFPMLYLGFSLGVNNPVGFFGLQMDVVINKKISAGTGIGLSTWGNKIAFEGRYYFDQYNRGWALGTGVTYSVGHKGLKLPGVETIFGEQDVVIDQFSQYNAMVSALYFIPMGRAKKTRFHLQAGYSIPLGTKGDFYCSTPLTSDGEKQIRFLAPGGFMFGTGLSF